MQTREAWSFRCPTHKHCCTHEPRDLFYVFLLIVLYLKLRRSNARRAELGLRENRLSDLGCPVKIERETVFKRNIKGKNT